MKVFFRREDDNIIYYVFDKEVSYNILKEYAHKLPAFISGVVDGKEEIAITYLNSNVKGCGTILLKSLVLCAYSLGVEKITLDDMSDRMGRLDNIYVKFGFKYIEKGFPEMEANVEDLIK